MKVLIGLCLITALGACKKKGREDVHIPDAALERIQYEGASNGKFEAIAFVDEALKKHGDLGVYGDLSGGLEELTKDMTVIIVDKDDYYYLDIAPLSDAGHDFSIEVNKETGELSDFTVGEVIEKEEFDLEDEDADEADDE